MKKIASIVLAAVMLLTATASCTGSQSGTTTSPTNAPAAPSTASTGSAPVEPAAQTAPEFEGYPMDRKSTTLSWYAFDGYRLNSSFASADQSPFHSGLAEMLGITIDWKFVPVGGDVNQNFNMMIASGDYPDIFQKDNVIKDTARYMDEGVVRDLTDYIQDYSPNYYAWIQTNEAYDKSMKTDAGRYFGYGFFREAGGWNDTYLGPVVRQDWLDGVGLEEPKTISDWDAVLRAFKDKYNGVLSFAKSRVENTGISGAFGSYGMLKFRTYVDNNNEIQLAQVQPEWRDYMAKLNEWWKEGLLDQDFLTTDDTAARTNALNGKMGISVTSMGQLSNWYGDAESAGNGAKWRGMQYPTGDDGTLSMVFGGYGIGNMAAVITTNCDDDRLETAMRALDYAYTEEGNLYWNYGKEGVSWEYDAEGKPMYTALVTEDPDGLNNAIDKYGGSTWSGACIQATLLLYLKNKPVAIEANDLWFYPNESISAHWTLPSGVAFTMDESNTMADIRSALDTYLEETAVKFITGEEPLANYDSFVSNVNNMRLSELLGIYQDAYNRYLAR